MERVEKTIFISYRRRTTVAWAIAVSQNLTNRGFDVFFDYTGIPSGDFERSILENVGARAHFLVLLAPSTLERINEPADWLRREIEYAIEQQRNVVPLFLEGFDFGAPGIAKQLTGRLAGLRSFNGLSVPAEYFDAAMEKLRQQFLSRPLNAVLHPVSQQAAETANEQQVAAQAAGIEPQELTASEWFEKGYLAVDHDEEIRYFTEAIRLKPDYATAYNNRGFARKGKGDLDGAMVDFDEAIRLKPDDAAAYYNRGTTRYEKGDLDGAIKDYDEAIRLKPDYADAYYNRGEAREGMADSKAAAVDFQRYLDLGGGQRDGDQAEVELRIHRLTNP